MNIDELREHLCERYPLLCPLFSSEFGDGTLTVAPEQLLDAARDLKELGFSRLDVVTAIDRGTTFELVYRLESSEIHTGLSLRCSVARELPRIASLVDLWPAADWQEREVFDLFGIEFEGHPDLRRILLPDEWVGHPLRRDYKDDRMVRRPDYV